MAPRTRKIRHDDNTRAKIQTTQLLKRLTGHALGNIEMSSTQVTAALGVLRKAMPDLAATELSGEVARPTVIRSPETVADSKAWLDKHGPERIEPDQPVTKPN